MGKKINLEGQRFGRLVVIKDAKKRAHNGDVIWLCHCDCGNLKESSGDHLRRGLIQSCGCFHDELFEITRIKYRYKHGEKSRNGPTKFYRVWLGIKSRCHNPNDKDYKYYGKKGIKICNKWKDDYLAFKKWALTNGYKLGLTIDRINSRGNYEPSNCQWITQGENTRKARIERLN